MTLVFNASPLIVLAKARLLDRFITLGDPGIVPQAVVDEVIRVDKPPANEQLQARQRNARSLSAHVA